MLASRGPARNRGSPTSSRVMSEIHRSAYCLYCYEPLEPSSKPTQRCPRCGKIHVQVNQAVFWSLEPALLRIERGIKLGVVLLMAALLVAVAKKMGMEAHRVNAVFIGPIAMLGGVLWWTAGLITRKPRYFSARLLWSTVLVLLVVVPPILLLVLDLQTHRGSFGPEYWRSLLFLTAPALPMVVLAACLRHFAGRFEEFKKRRIESGSR